MDFTNKDIRPDYKKIYTDILNKKIPEKKEECKHFLKKANLSSVDIIELNNKLFGINKETEKFDQRHRSYSKSDILRILDYQKKNKLNNSQLANHFRLSRNTVTKWNKLFV
ncbi:MAG: transposase [Chryseobacterium sp. 39-10]|nr:helix-turn-helix domain-containing protein [Chryseobacterium sp.]OJV47795.1 MAG: transposase [Chryseobacterium sp. 39-10]